MNARPLFFDIETQRTGDPAVIARLQDAIKPPGNYKKPDSIAQWWASEGVALKAQAANKTALDGTYGRVAAFGHAVGDGEIFVISAESLSEERLLEHVATVFAEAHADRYVAFNGEFDVRFLYKRFVINSIEPPAILKRLLNERDALFDPMRIWEGWKGYISQTDMEYALGIQREDKIDGSMVGDHIDIGDWATVRHHNSEDIRCLREIYRRL